MHKCNELSQDLIQSWKIGWPEYIYMANQDNGPICEIAEKCAQVARVTLEEEEGYRRVLNALASIASYCKQSTTWRANNLYQINKALQSILLEMMADKRIRQAAEFAQSAADRSFEKEQIERQRVAREMDESKRKSQQWVNENWNEDLDKQYNAWKRTVTPSKIISIDLAKAKSIDKAM